MDRDVLLIDIDAPNGWSIFFKISGRFQVDGNLYFEKKNNLEK